MWLFSETGFVSIVRDPQDKDKMVVRARDKDSLKPLVEEYGVKIVNLKNRDYPHRVFLTRKQFVDWLIQTGEDLEYTNYKNQVSKTRGYDFASPLHDVWSTMLRLEDLGTPRFKQRSYGYSYMTTDHDDAYLDELDSYYPSNRGGIIR
jgi:hypothetical protein